MLGKLGKHLGKVKKPWSGAISGYLSKILGKLGPKMPSDQGVYDLGKAPYREESLSKALSSLAPSDGEAIAEGVGDALAGLR